MSVTYWNILATIGVALTAIFFAWAAALGIFYISDAPPGESIGRDVVGICGCIANSVAAFAGVAFMIYSMVS